MNDGKSSENNAKTAKPAVTTTLPWKGRLSSPLPITAQIHDHVDGSDYRFRGYRCEVLQGMA